MERLFEAPETLDKGRRRLRGRNDGCLDDEQLPGDAVQLFEAEDQVLQVINKAERECDVEFANDPRVQLVDVHAPVFDIESENFADEERLPDMLALRIDPQRSVRAATFGLDAVEAGVAADIEHRFAAQVRRQALPDD